jgi:cobalamin biosynthesis protein CobD/CbiB
VSFLLFSLVFGISSILFQIHALPKLALTFLHFIVNLVSFIFNILRTAERSSSQVFVGAFVFVGIYLVASLLIWLITIPLRKKEPIIENEETL